ncbi:MAG: serine hydrolase [Prosthecobacter sp.]
MGNHSLKITARMVMNHTSGFPNWRGKDGLKVLYEPGIRFGYSGEGFQLLQLVLTKITGTNHESLMQAALLRPLDMTGNSHILAACFSQRLQWHRFPQPRRI